MYFLGNGDRAILGALLAQGMRGQIAFSNLAPGTAIPLAYSGVTVILLVMSIDHFLMLFTITVVC